MFIVRFWNKKKIFFVIPSLLYYLVNYITIKNAQPSKVLVSSWHRSLRCLLLNLIFISLLGSLNIEVWWIFKTIIFLLTRKVLKLPAVFSLTEMLKIIFNTFANGTSRPTPTYRWSVPAVVHAINYFGILITVLILRLYIIVRVTGDTYVALLGELGELKLFDIRTEGTSILQFTEF